MVFFLYKNPTRETFNLHSLCALPRLWLGRFHLPPLIGTIPLTLHAHTLSELNLSLDSLHNNAQLVHQKQQAFQDTQNLNTRLKTHFSFYPPLEPLSLIPSLIELAKTHQLTLLSLEPNVSTSSLNIKGYGGFEDFKKLLFTLESHNFLSLDFLSLSPRAHSSINFTLTLIHHIPNLRS